MRLDLTGKRFGKWLVLEDAGLHKSSRDRVWLCKCKCGRERKVKTYYLTKGHSKKCQFCGWHDKRNYSKDSIPECLWNRILSNAKKRNISVEITSQYAFSLLLKQNKRCKLSGVKLKFPKNGTDLLDVGCISSLDRINSKFGYVKGNIQWVHRDVNLMKNVLCQNRFLKICKTVADYNTNS